jgi:hypothetical protein
MGLPHGAGEAVEGADQSGQIVGGPGLSGLGSGRLTGTAGSDAGAFGGKLRQPGQCALAGVNLTPVRQDAGRWPTRRGSILASQRWLPGSRPYTSRSTRWSARRTRPCTYPGEKNVIDKSRRLQPSGSSPVVSHRVAASRPGDTGRRRARRPGPNRRLQHGTSCCPRCMRSGPRAAARGPPGALGPRRSRRLTGLLWSDLHLDGDGRGSPRRVR